MTWIEESLALLLPSEEETALLGACLLTGTPAREAWSRWRGAGPPVAAGLPDRIALTRTLVPLLAVSATANGLPMDPATRSYLHASSLREELRAKRYRRIVAEALAALDLAGTAVWVTRGAALAATVYREWSHRHCHDLDLLVAPENLADAVRALTGSGWTVRSPGNPRRESRLRHSSGLGAGLHTTPFDVPYYGAPLADFAGGPARITVDGVPARIPSRESLLIHVLGHAAYSSSRASLRWVTDAWHLLAAGTGLGWTEVTARLATYGLALPASVLVRYLAQLGAPVPSTSLTSIRQWAQAAGRAEEDAALAGSYRGAGGDLPRLWRAQRTWRGRMGVARWAVAPSAGYLRSAFAPRPAWLLPLCYVYRPARYLAGALGRRPAVAEAEME